MCAGMDVREGAAWFQRIWSNQSIQQHGDPCVPPGEPVFFDVTPRQSWYPVTAGGQVTIPAVAWAAGAIHDWITYVEVGYSSSGSFTAALLEARGVPRLTMNAGDTIHVVVGAPAQASSGDYAIVWIVSLDPASPSFIVGRTWPVGVYVP
jgi:hypothetical protein